MTLKQAIKFLKLILKGQTQVNISTIKEPIDVLINTNEIQRKNNENLSKKIKRQRNVLAKLEKEIKELKG